MPQPQRELLWIGPNYWRNTQQIAGKVEPQSVNKPNHILRLPPNYFPLSSQPLLAVGKLIDLRWDERAPTWHSKLIWLPPIEPFEIVAKQIFFIPQFSLALKTFWRSSCQLASNWVRSVFAFICESFGGRRIPNSFFWAAGDNFFSTVIECRTFQRLGTQKGLIGFVPQVICIIVPEARANWRVTGYKDMASSHLTALDPKSLAIKFNEN